jgi:predicted O-methyltransferase YrrM
MTRENDIFKRSDLSCREELADLLNSYQLLGRAVEIGTHMGRFAADFLSRWKGKRLYCIDPWIRNLPGYVDILADQDRDEHFRIAIRNLRPYLNRVRIVKETSSQAVAHFTDNSLDFVYIDGNHQPAGVRADIADYWPKVAPGGVFAGHDLNNDWEFSVKPAVREFCQREGLRCYVIPGEMESWYVMKPELAKAA